MVYIDITKKSAKYLKVNQLVQGVNVNINYQPLPQTRPQMCLDLNHYIASLSV